MVLPELFPEMMSWLLELPGFLRPKLLLTLEEFVNLLYFVEHFMLDLVSSLSIFSTTLASLLLQTLIIETT